MIINKLSEAKFFLEKMEHCGYNVFEFNCYFSAFVSSARSFTWGLKKHMSGIKGFSEFWEKLTSEKLSNEIAKKFVSIRNFIEKEVDNKIVGGSVYREGEQLKAEYFFDDNRDKNVLTLSKEYFETLNNIKDLVVKEFMLDDPSSPYYWKDILELGNRV